MKITTTTHAIAQSKPHLLIVPLPTAAHEGAPKASSPANNKRRTKTSTPTLTLETLGIEPSLLKELCHLDSAAAEQLEEGLTRLELTQVKEGQRFDLPLYLTKEKRAVTVRFVALPTTTNLHGWRKMGGDALLAAKKLRAKELTLCLSPLTAESAPEVVQAVTEGLTLASYTFDHFKEVAGKKTGAAPSFQPERTTLQLASSLRLGAQVTSAIKRGEAVAEAVKSARDLINSPPNVTTPKTLATFARKLASESKGRIKAEIFGTAALKKLGAGALLAVAAGSDEEPFLIHLHYKPQKRTKHTRTVTIVGKGITFDSGGLSIKTGKGMEDMKADMSGAAAALHIMKAVSALTSISPLEHELHVLVPTCENMINGRATRPGDIVYAMNGKSIEILNTDAEGRLILADALSYAERLHPEIVIDIATLTGACIVALGDEYAGLFSNTPALQESIVTLGEQCGERYWPLPLAPEYRASIDSPVAYLKNIAASGPGAIIAALFLKEFVPEGAAWAHLDIAGPAYQTRATEVLSHGGTGFSITTLLHLLYSAELVEITAHEGS